MKSRKSYALFVLICGIFSTTFLAISLGLDAGATPLFFAGLRFSGAGLVLVCLVFARRALSPRSCGPKGSGRAVIDGRSGRALRAVTPVADADHRGPSGAVRYLAALAPRSTLLSLFLTVGTFGLMFLAQTRVDSGFMARLDATGPLVTALLSLILLGKRFNVLHGLAFLLGSAGGILIAAPTGAADGPFVLAAAGSVVVYAVGTVLYPLLFREDEDPVAVSALQSLAGGLVLLVLASFTECPVLPAAALGPLVYLTLIGSVLGQTASLVLVRDAGPVFASAWLYVAPPAASLVGAFFRDERLGPGGAFGMILALAGVLLMTRAENEPRRAGADRPPARGA